MEPDQMSINIGDAGDGAKSPHGQVSDLTGDEGWMTRHETSPVWVTVTEIREVLQTGNTSGLHSLLARLDSWKQNARSAKEALHNYWRVCQYVGETELSNIHVLLNLAVEKVADGNDSDGPRWWAWLGDLCRLLSLCLVNRETVFRLMANARSLCSMLVVAFYHGYYREDNKLAWDCLHILQVAATVCKSAFVKRLVEDRFLDQLVDKIKLNDLPLPSDKLFKKILDVVASLLMCGHTATFQYAVSCIDALYHHSNNRVTNTKNNDDDDNTNSSTIVTTIIEHIPGPGADAIDQSQKTPGSANQSMKNKIDSSNHSYLSELYESSQSTRHYGKTTARNCAAYWAMEKSRKELLSSCLGITDGHLYIYCSWPACGLSNTDPNAFFRKCGACRNVRYCSRRCQEMHWNAGHKLQCKRSTMKRATSV